MATAVEKMTVQDKLLLAQAVYKVGASSWQIVSNLLTEHPCCKDRPELFTPEACEESYVSLMKGIEVNVYVPMSHSDADVPADQHRTARSPRPKFIYSSRRRFTSPACSS